MSGNHSAHSHAAHSTRRKSSGSTWKVVVLIVLLVIVIIALGVLLAQLLGVDILGTLGLGGGNATPNVAPGVTTQVQAEYGSGKNMAGNLTITQGTQRPEEIPETADVVLLDITWTGKKAMNEPLYITVSDPSFTDGDGLAVYHYGETGQWDKIGEYEIRNNSVTFLATSLSPFAFQILSSEPEPIATEEPSPTPEPTATPVPTPTPTPAPIQVVDYGTYTGVQTGVYSLAGELEDDQTYVVALVKDLPADAFTAAGTEDGGQTEEEEDDADAADDTAEDGLTISYVDAPEASAPAEVTTDQAAAAPAANTRTASVLMNLGGGQLGVVDMNMAQADNGAWCLMGPITDGMVWTSNRDAYKDEHRFSLKNNDRYLNLDDDAQNIILNENGTRTRWLVQTATLMDNSQIETLTYRDGDRYYITQMAMVAETLPGGNVSVAPTQAPDGTTPAAAPGIVYLGMAAPQDTTAVQETMKFTVSTDEHQAQQLVLFKLDSSQTAPAGAVTTLEHNIVVPDIVEGTNLSTLAIKDGDTFLQLGTDYTVNARIVGDHVVVIIQFIGSYSGQIVRTYPGSTITTNEMIVPSTTPAPSPTPPSPSPTPYYGGGEGGGNYYGGGNGGGGTSSGSNDPPTPAHETNTEVLGGETGASTDTNTSQ